MKIINTKGKPFLFILPITLIVVIVLLIMQYQSGKNSFRLQRNNEEAVRIFQINSKMERIINHSYFIETTLDNFLITKKAEAFVQIPKAIDSLTVWAKELKLLVSNSKNNGTTDSLFSSIQTLAQFYKNILNISYINNDSSKSLLVSDHKKLLYKNITTTVTRVKSKLENDLENSIIENTTVSKKVQQFNQWLVLLTIVTIIVLGTIIVRHLQKNSRLIQDLEIAKNKANRAVQTKEQFLANMSHEIRPPINSVIGFTELLHKTNLDQEQQQFVELINASGKNLLTIINDILDMSKLEANMVHLDKKSFRLKELLQTLEMMFAHKAKEKTILYLNYIHPAVPETIIGDRERLNQVLTNLITNAFKFTHEGKITLSVEAVKKTEALVTLRFTVTDTGIGIASDKLKTIFDRFEQADSETTRKYGGTGLGLSIVKSIVTLHDGYITVKSDPGKGSAFSFDINYAVDQTATKSKGNFTVKSSDLTTRKFLGKTSLPGISILAAEDNKVNQILLKFIFKQWQVDFELVETGEQVLEALQKSSFDILLLDIQMPVLGGYSTARSIRSKLKSSIPIIAMTAHALPGEKEKCIDCGMNDYISKPLNENSLQEIIKNQIAKIKTTPPPLYP